MINASRALQQHTEQLGATLLRPLDRARRHLIHALGPVARTLIRDRELRVVSQGLLFVALSLTSCLLLPMWTLVLGPLILGVPHLVADLRYLVVRPGFHRDPRLLGLVAPLLLAAALGYGVNAGLLAATAVLLSLRAPIRRKLMVSAWLLPLALGAAQLQQHADLVFAHAHNAVALLLWWLLSPGGWRRAGVIGAYALALIALYAGLADLALTQFTPGLTLSHHLNAIAPGVPQPMGGRLVIAFAFAQSTHYLVWLRLMPDEARASASPRTFAASWRALVRELGAPLMLAALLISALLLAAALNDLLLAHLSYLRLAAFHGSLELCALVGLALGHGGRR